MQPLPDRPLVRYIEQKPTAKPREGDVLAVGNGKILDDGAKLADAKAGDKIFSWKYSRLG